MKTNSVPQMTFASSAILNRIVSQPITLYAKLGNQLCIHLNRCKDTVARDVGVHLSGRYADAS